jgi:hypothetical protein
MFDEHCKVRKGEIRKERGDKGLSKEMKGKGAL